MAREKIAGTPSDAPRTSPAAAHDPADDDTVFAFLELDQLVADTSRPVSRATLTGRVRAGLWALRVFVVVVSLMVIYTFIHQL